MYVLYMNYINETTNNLMNVLLKNEKQIFQCYHEYLNVFSKNKINKLSVHDSQNHVINIKKKNRHSLSFIEKILNQLIDIKKHIKLNIQHAYNLIRIKPGDE